MESLRSGKFKPLTLADVAGRSKEFAFDCEGQKVLVTLLEKESVHGGGGPGDAVFDELFKDGGALAMAFEGVGSIFLERTLEGIAKRETAFPAFLAGIVAKSLNGSILKLALHALGCRVLQKLLEALPDAASRLALVDELKGTSMATCVESCHGNYVVQKIVTTVKGPGTTLVLDSLGRGDPSVRHLASHNFGCRVVQRMLEVSPEDIKAPLLDSLIRMAPDLICDTYG